MSADKKALGRGLDALFGDRLDNTAREVVSQDDAPVSGTSFKSQKLINVANLRASDAQPRRYFDEESLQQLASSIKEHGVLQPLLVRPILGNVGEYEIIAGERRWRAAQKAQTHEIPVIVREFTDLEALEIALVENLQRSDLTPIEEAEGFKRLMDEFGHTQEKLAEALGKSRSHIANMMRLLKLPETVREKVHAGEISAGHARALLSAKDPEAMAKRMVKEGMNVRDLERAVSEEKAPIKVRPRPAPTMGSKDTNIKALEKSLEEQIGLKVSITYDQKGSGALTIKYQNLDQLDDVLAKLTHAS